jgi:outer membrane protein assembly factor BamB
MRRRTFLAGMATSTGSALAGCSSNGSSTPSRTPTASATETDTETATAGPTATETATAEPTATETTAVGESRWRFETGKKQLYAPAVGDGLVFLLSGGTVRAFDTETGATVTTSHVGGETADPVVAGDTLYVPAAQNLTALAADQSLTRQWQFTEPEKNLGTPAFTSESVFVVEQDSTDQPTMLHRLDPASGALRWSRDIASGVLLAEVTESTVYIADRRFGGIAALEPADGTERWRYTPESMVFYPPTVDGDTLYVGTGGPSSEGKIQALDPRDGSEKWAITDGDLGWAVHVDEERFYVGGSGIQAVTRSDRSPAWQVDKEGTVQLTVVNGRVYATVGKDAVYAFDGATGETRWSTTLQSSPTGRPVYGDGHVYARDTEGILYAIEAE